MKKVFLFCVICLSFSFVFGQEKSGSLVGKIIDVNTSEVLSEAEVQIKGGNLYAMTDALGNYKIDNIPEGNYQVEVSLLGYEKQVKNIEIKSNKRIVLNFSLDVGAFTLSDITLTAKTEARKLREEAMPISVISMDQLKGTVTSVSDVLTKTVGVTIRSSGGVGASSRLSVRGLEGKRIGFFINEVPLNDQSDFVDLNDIPVDMIDRIEIYKGVVPAKFGGSSMGGAVNIVLREYPERYADMSYSLESFNTHKVQAVVKRNLEEKGFTFGVGGQYTYSDNDYEMIPPAIGRRDIKVKRDHDKFKKIVAGGSVVAKKWWFDKVEIEPVFLDTYREIQGVETNIRDAFVESRAYIIANTLEKDNFLINGLDFDMSTALAYTQYSLVDTAKVWYDWYGNAYKTPSPYGGEIGNRYASDSDNKKMNLMNKLNLSYLINKQHSLNFNSFFTLANGYPKDELRVKSMGKETQFDTKMNSLVAGLNYDFRTQDDKFLNSFTTRYYLYTMDTKNNNIYGAEGIKEVNLNKSDFGISDAMRYKFTPDFIGKLAVGYDVRIPTETELLGDGYSITPSEQLLPERNTSINAGLLYDLTGKKSSNLQLELSGYYMHLKDMIRFVKGFLGAQYQNFGEMRTLGVELEAKADVMSFLYAYGNVTYQDLRDVRMYNENSTVANPTKGKRMPNIPYFLANAGLEFHKENLFGGKGQNTRIFTDLAFIEEYLYDFEMTTGQRRIPRSTVIDLGFEHSLFNRHLFISGKVKNITDAEVLSEFNRPLPGRSFMIKLRYVFTSGK